MKSIKRKISVLLTMVMIFSMFTSVFAQSTVSAEATPVELTSADQESAIKITTENVGDILYIFKVIDVGYDVDSNTVTYAFADFYADFFGDHEVDTIDEYMALSADGVKDLYGELSAYTVGKEGWKTSATVTATTVADGLAATASINLSIGQYLVIGGGNATGAKVYSPVSIEVVPVVVNGSYVIYSSYDVVMKTTDATVSSKEIINGVEENSEDTIGVGDIFTYQLEVTVPTYPEDATNTTYFIKDTFSEGITIVGNSVVVKNGDAEISSDAYSVTVSGQIMYIDFDYSKISAYTSLTVTYDAYLNEKAVVGTAEGNVNSATLTYSNSPYIGTSYDPESNDDRPDENTTGYHTTTEVEEVVYTYGIYVDKYEDGNASTKLAGAVFNIYTNAECTGDEIGTITTDANGIGLYEGLAAGTYYLKEMKAPAGYNLLADSIEVIVGADTMTYKVANTTTIEYVYTSVEGEAIIKGQAKNPANDTQYVWINTTTGEVTFENAQPSGYVAAYVSDIKSTTTATANAASSGVEAVGVQVANNKGNILPSAGGTGVVMFYAIGGTLVLAAIIILVYKKCKKSKINCRQ